MNSRVMLLCGSMQMRIRNEPYNRYPDPLQQKVKEGIAQIRDVRPGNIFLGVGSDECIDLAYRIFCEPAKDNVVAYHPLMECMKCVRI